MQYTSGTTGFPKGAVLSHRGLTNNARFGLSRMGANRGDTYLIALAGRLRLSLHDHLWPDRNLADPDPDAGDRRLDRTNDADGWLHTGDLGTMAARGYVCVTGRLKDMIIRGGENLFPAEIENVLITHPDVAEVAVVGVPDPRGARWPSPSCVHAPPHNFRSPIWSGMCGTTWPHQKRQRTGSCSMLFP